MPVKSGDQDFAVRCGMLFRSAKFDPPGFSAPETPYRLLPCNYPGISQKQAVKTRCANCSNTAKKLAAPGGKGFITRCAGDREKYAAGVDPAKMVKAVSPEEKRINQEWNDYLAGEMAESEITQLESFPDRTREGAVSYPHGEDNR